MVEGQGLPKAAAFQPHLENSRFQRFYSVICDQKCDKIIFSRKPPSEPLQYKAYRTEG
jgi:hypothetical protein